MGISALMAGAYLGHVALLALLLNAKADVNHADNVSQMSLDYNLRMMEENISIVIAAMTAVIKRKHNVNINSNILVLWQDII
jgi:hypothetical protein